MTASSILPKRVTRAMATRLDQVNNDPKHLKQRISQLEQQVEYLKSLLRDQSIEAAPVMDPVTPTGWEQIGAHHYRLNGREAGNQKLLALRMGAGQDRVSKWFNAHRLQTVITPDGAVSFWLDQGKPSRKKKSPKVKKSVQ